MVGVLRLRRTDQSFKLTETTQILQAGIFQEKWPASESAADTPLEPFERCLVLPEHRKNASDLVIRVMSVSKGFWTAKFITPEVEFNIAGYGLCCTLEGPLRHYAPGFSNLRRYRKDTPPLQPLY
jgi:hypothetical protein